MCQHWCRFRRMWLWFQYVNNRQQMLQCCVAGMLRSKMLRYPNSRTPPVFLFWTRPKRRAECLPNAPAVLFKTNDEERRDRHSFMHAQPPTERQKYTCWAYTFQNSTNWPRHALVDIKPGTQQRSDCRWARLSRRLRAAITSRAVVSDWRRLIGTNFSAEWSRNWRWHGVPLCRTSWAASHSSRLPFIEFYRGKIT